MWTIAVKTVPPKVVTVVARGVLPMRVGLHRLLGAYKEVFPNIRHTLRQRMSRWVRQALSFSKKLDNPIGGIGDFVYHDNATRRAEANPL